MNCINCNYDLDGGDIAEVLGNTEIAKKYYDWSYENKKRFTKAVIVQYDNSRQQEEICPNCKCIDPLKK